MILAQMKVEQNEPLIEKDRNNLFIKLWKSTTLQISRVAYSLVRFEYKLYWK